MQLVKNVGDLRMAFIINGKVIAEQFVAELQKDVEALKKSRKIDVCLALINIIGDAASEIYIQNKVKLAAITGIKSKLFQFEPTILQNELKKFILSLNQDKSIHGILLQLPLPESFPPRNFINLIDPIKDVDGLTIENQGKLFTGESGIYPCTPLGIMHLLHTVHEKLSGLHAVVIGRSSIVGRPLGMMLLQANCTVTSVHSYTNDLKDICKKADILISAVGKPHFVADGSWIKPGATVIDVGVNRILNENGEKKVVGDVNFDLVKDYAGAITPVPRGVGPMTVAYLMHNTLKAAVLQSQ